MANAEGLAPAPSLAGRRDVGRVSSFIRGRIPVCMLAVVGILNVTIFTIYQMWGEGGGVGQWLRMGVPLQEAAAMSPLPVALTRQEHLVGDAAANSPAPASSTSSTAPPSTGSDRFSFPWPARHSANTPLWASDPASLLPSLATSRNRAYVSSLPADMSDGIGYRVCFTTFELHAAALLNVTYIHRWSAYGSLTREDDTAVERLFGWGGGGGVPPSSGGDKGGGGGTDVPLRRQVYAAACDNVEQVKDSCGRKRVLCTRLKEGGGGGFRHLVIVPEKLLVTHQLSSKEESVLALEEAPRRSPELVAFLAEHDKPGTLFQLGNSSCYYDLPIISPGDRQRISDMYWDRRALEASDPKSATRAAWIAARDRAAPNFPRASMLSNPGTEATPRPPVDDDPAAAAIGGATLGMDPLRVHLVAHVRRGDLLLNISEVSHRVVFSDAQYVAALRLAAEAIAEEEEAQCAGAGGPNWPLAFTFHILSQGAPKPNARIFSHHSSALYTHMYADENGTVHDEGYWTTAMTVGWDAASGTAPASTVDALDSLSSSSTPSPRLDVTVAEHISAPTIPSLATMFAADVLLASSSAMSMTLGSISGRGVLLLPASLSKSLPGSIIWEPNNRQLDVGAVRQAWREYRDVSDLGEWGCRR